MIAGLLLAAGSARRFGAQKLLVEVEGKPLIRWSAERLCALQVVELVVVVPPEYAALGEALAGLGARFAVNDDAASGVASSIARGVDAISPKAQAVIVALADSPASPVVLRRIADRYYDGGASIVAPSYRGVFAPPVLFDRAMFGELRALSGDHGARSVVEREANRVAQIEVPEPPPIDVDTPDDLARLRREVHLSSSSTPREP